MDQEPNSLIKKLKLAVKSLSSSLITQTLSIDKISKTVTLRDNFFGTNIKEAYYILKGYKVIYENDSPYRGLDVHRF